MAFNVNYCIELKIIKIVSFTWINNMYIHPLFQINTMYASPFPKFDSDTFYSVPSKQFVIQ